MGGGTGGEERRRSQVTVYKMFFFRENICNPGDWFEKEREETFARSFPHSWKNKAMLKTYKIVEITEITKSLHSIISKFLTVFFSPASGKKKKQKKLPEER